MRVLVCLDKFRGSATAVEACRAVADGIRRAAPAADVLEIPVADGGEGTVDALVAAGWQRETRTVTGPLGEPVDAAFARRGSRVVVEMAQASGHPPLRRPPGPDEAGRATTRGTGELLGAALDGGCTELVLAAGGSGTTDGGAGMLAALGARLHDAHGDPVPDGGAGLAGLAAVDLAALDPRLTGLDVTLAADVDSPLLGPHGAAAVFGPQKGADPPLVARLDGNLTRWADLLEAATGMTARGRPAAGAAGGLGFAAFCALRARHRPGIEVLLDELDVAAALPGASLVVVGEGRLDAQSLTGKAPLGVARLAGRYGVPVVAVAGQVTVDAAALARAGIDGHVALVDLADGPDDAVARAIDLLEQAGDRLLRDRTE